MGFSLMRDSRYSTTLVHPGVVDTKLIDAGIVKKVDVEAAARLLNGAALNAALWVSASDKPEETLAGAIEAFTALASGLLAD